MMKHMYAFFSKESDLANKSFQFEHKSSKEKKSNSQMFTLAIFRNKNVRSFNTVSLEGDLSLMWYINIYNRFSLVCMHNVKTLLWIAFKSQIIIFRLVHPSEISLIKILHHFFFFCENNSNFEIIRVILLIFPSIYLTYYCWFFSPSKTLLSEPISDESRWPPELILLREKFTAKSQLEVAQLQIKHEEEVS